MAGLIPFNRKRNQLGNTGYDLYNMIDDFFNDSWLPGRNLALDTFKVDVREDKKGYVIEAELPGVNKDEISLSLEENSLTISVKREESINDESNNYIHRERRLSSMARTLRLADATPDDIKAKLDNGVLSIMVAKKEKSINAHKIAIE